jgi:flagellar hook-length control protein FliK
MFQLPLLGSVTQDLIKGQSIDRSDADTLILLDLLQGADPAPSGPSGDMQAMLLQLPMPVQRVLESLVSGGMTLPQAAGSLLADATSGPVGDKFAEFLRQRLSSAPVAAPDAGSTPPMGPPLVARPAAEAVPIPAMGAVEVLGATVDSAGTTLPAMPPVTPAAQTVTGGVQQLSSQLAGSLLDMGVPQAVGAKGWDVAVADRVVWMVQGEQQLAKLTLNPPNLGPLEVRVSVQHDQASVSFVAQHAAVREALEAALPRLRELFDQQSLQLVRADVSDADTYRGRGSEDDGAGGGQRSGSAADERVPDDGDLSSAYPVAVSSRLLDLFA